MADTTILDPNNETASPNGSEPIEWLDPEDETAMRQFIFQAQDRPQELVEIPAWRLRILVRGMSGTQRAQYEANPRDPETGRFSDLRHVYFGVVQMCCVHPRTKKQIFKYADRDTFMDEKDGAIIDMLAARALRLSGLLPAQTERIRKNSETTPTSTATTDSQSDSATTT